MMNLDSIYDLSLSSSFSKIEAGTWLNFQMINKDRDVDLSLFGQATVGFHERGIRHPDILEHVVKLILNNEPINQIPVSKIKKILECNLEQINIQKQIFISDLKKLPTNTKEYYDLLVKFKRYSELSDTVGSIKFTETKVEI